MYRRSSIMVDAMSQYGVESGTDGAHRRAARMLEEDDMPQTARTVQRASCLRLELVGS